MSKRIFRIVAAFSIILLLAGCNRQSSDSLETYDLPSGEISEYLPITLQDQFKLTSTWHYYNYPYAKTDFSESDLMVIYRAINSFCFYGFTHPWAEELRFGSPPVLHATNESHKTAITFIWHEEWGSLAAAWFEDEPGLAKWFTMDCDAQHEIRALLWGPGRPE
ncbi:MAG: hypothetical protein FWC70_04280 [Defluviitaleaceae bacterium]|nr:hypothetical protein [Defluviitaleaceae bacterium]